MGESNVTKSDNTRNISLYTEGHVRDRMATESGVIENAVIRSSW